MYDGLNSAVVVNDLRGKNTRMKGESARTSPVHALQEVIQVSSTSHEQNLAREKEIGSSQKRPRRNNKSRQI